MRKSVITVAAAGLFGSSGFLLAAHAVTPPPTYSSPCGHSIETGPAPATPTLIGVPPSGTPGTSGEVGVIGPDGYIEAVGNANGPSGHVSGATARTSPDGSGKPALYGQVGNDNGTAVCVGSGSTTVNVPLP